MILKNVGSQGVYLYAFTVADSTPKTGDAANITGAYSLDGAAEHAGFATANPTEIGGGLYWQPLAQSETNGNAFGYRWASTTSGVQIDPLFGLTTGVNLPVAAPGAANGLNVLDGSARNNVYSVSQGVTLAADQAVNATKIGGQTVTAAGGITVAAYVGTSAASTAQTGDAYGRLGAPAGASVSADIAAVKTSVGTPQQDGSAVTLPASANIAITGNITGNLSGSVGSVTGAVGSVTGNVGGSVASVTAGVTLAATQTAYAPAKAGDAMTLTAAYDAAKTAASQASVNAIPTTAAPTASEVATAVWGAVSRTLSAFAFEVTVGTNTDKTGYSLTTTPPTADTIAEAVWDLATSGHTTAGTFGAAMAAAGSAGDPWITDLPGSYAEGTAGYLLGNLSGAGGGATAAEIVTALSQLKTVTDLSAMTIVVSTWSGTAWIDQTTSDITVDSSGNITSIIPRMA